MKVGRAALLCLLLSAFVSAAAGSDDRERILSFHSDVIVHPDASMAVEETIRVLSRGRQIRHGIYRDFPTRYRDRLGNHYSVGFVVTRVLRDGRPEPYHIEDISDGKRVYIGRSDTFVSTGEHVYALAYRTRRQLGFFADHDELYWNVTGNGWIFPIDSASATVLLPGEAGRHLLSAEAYTGPQGARGNAYQSSVGPDGAVSFRTTAPLGARQGLTIAVSWPKGFVTQPSLDSEVRDYLQDNPTIVAASLGVGIVLCYYFFVWVLVGRDPKPGTVIPLYHPPDGLSPAAVRYLVKMGYDDKLLAAAVIDMAVKGYVTIGKPDSVYEIKRANGDKSALAPEEARVAGALLAGSSHIRLENSNHKTIQAAILALKNSLSLQHERIHFVTNRRYLLPGLTLSVMLLLYGALPAKDLLGVVFISIWLTVWTIAVAALLVQAGQRWREALWQRSGRALHVFSALTASLITIPFAAGEAFGLYAFAAMTTPAIVAMLLVLAGLNLLFHYLLKAPTRAGRQILDRIEGFRMFLAVAEKDRLNLQNPPERTPELFEQYLPYALALDVEQEWSEQFAEVLAQAGKAGVAYSPTWYSGSDWNAMGGAQLASSLGGDLSSAISSSSSAPGTSSGGGGGGSSGGGGGGGGGGGW
jgi:uncharacterized membrane protein YgcG